MEQVEIAINELIISIKETEQYRDYQRQKEKVKRQPDLKKKIDEFRLLNYQVQNGTAENELFEKLEQMEQEYADFWAEPIVKDFLDAELAFCRMIQEINAKITDALDFE